MVSDTIHRLKPQVHHAAVDRTPLQRTSGQLNATAPPTTSMSPQLEHDAHNTQSHVIQSQKAQPEVVMVG